MGSTDKWFVDQIGRIWDILSPLTPALSPSEGEREKTSCLFLSEKLHFRAQLWSKKTIGIEDLHLYLQSALGAIGLGRDFSYGTGINFIRIGFGADATFLLERNFGKIGFVHINFHLQIFWIRNGQQRGAGTTPAA